MKPPAPLLSASLLVLAGLSTARAAPPAGRPTVDHAWARPTMGAMGMSAVYLDIHGGGAPDRLVGVSTPAGSLELHESAIAGGMSTMRAAPALPVPAHGLVRLAPGGYHLMLTRPAHPLKLGDHVRVALRFARSGTVTVDAPVSAAAPR